MKNKRFIPLLTLVWLFSHGCDQSRFNLDVAIIPREVTNFKEVNSYRDDFNSAGPLFFATEGFSLVFSSNRNSDGDDFDLISYQCMIHFDQVNPSFEIWPDPLEYPFIDTVNSPFNEWGPFLTTDLLHHQFNGTPMPETARIFFSSDREEDPDLYYGYYSTGEATLLEESPAPLDALNTEYTEGYLCLHPDTLANQETCYFTSDRDGSFDIFMARSEENKSIEKSETLVISKVIALSGDADDHCPYIINDMMVFASNRAGGYGGYDLWFSRYDNGAWSAPENFGPGINTDYDEFRPVIIPLRPDLFLNDMLIFSSNRREGKGGFDLYYTGMDKRNNL